MTNYERCWATTTLMADRVLLDTNVLFRAAFEPEKLTSTARAILTSPDWVRLLSPISTNELGIKSGQNKLTFPLPLRDWIAALTNSIKGVELPLTHQHAAMIETLPWHHKDPFDRLLIAQALAEGIPIISSDRVFDVYGVARIW